MVVQAVRFKLVSQIGAALSVCSADACCLSAGYGLLFRGGSDELIFQEDHDATHPQGNFP
eukprot:COSAG02_NODE_43309_length_376_cov_0.610108_2_plen_59_part_01